MDNYRAEVGVRWLINRCKTATLRDLAGGVKRWWFNPWDAAAQAIDQMQDGQDGMGEEHARPGVAHYCSYSLPFFRRIAVDRAFAAGGFVFLKGTVV